MFASKVVKPETKPARKQALRYLTPVGFGSLAVKLFVDPQRMIGNQATLGRNASESSSISPVSDPKKGADQMAEVGLGFKVDVPVGALPGHPISKLPIGRPGDRHEREAEKISTAILKSVPPSSVRETFGDGNARDAAPPGAGPVALSPGSASPAESRQTPVSPIVNNVLTSAGRPLDPPTRRLMETQIGHDFSRIRIHADVDAARAARSLNALAFAFGNDLVFGAGRYEPQTFGGQKILAHELVHSLQQENQKWIQCLGGDEETKSEVQKIFDQAETTEDLGQRLFQMALDSPENISVITEDLKEKISYFNIDNVAYYFVNPANETELGRIASSEAGEKLLKYLSEQMGGLHPETAEIEKIQRVLGAAATKAAQEEKPFSQPTPEQVQSTIAEVIADFTVDPADWKKLFSLQSAAIQSGLRDQGVPDDQGQLIAMIATRPESIYVTARNNYVAHLDPNSLALQDEPVLALVEAALEDQMLTLEEAQLLREAAIVGGADINSLLAGSMPAEAPRRNLAAIINASLKFAGTDAVFPIKLTAVEGSGLTTQTDPRVLTFRMLLQKPVWKGPEKKLAYTIMQIEPSPDSNKSLMEMAGLDKASTDLLVEKFFAAQSTSVSDMELLEIGFVQHGAQWSLAESSKYDLNLPWHPQLLSSPSIADPNRTVRYLPAASAVPRYRFLSNTEADANKIEANLGELSIDVFIPVDFAFRQDDILSQLRDTLLRVPVNDLKSIKTIEFDPAGDSEDSWAAAGSVQGKITIYKGRAAGLADFMHEVGHQVAFEQGKIFLPSTWETAMKKDGIGISMYGFKGLDDDFAESYMFYQGAKNSPDARKRYPNRFAVLDGIK